ncbi:MAG: hypothetical protein ACRDSE_22290 [Pseudonocardiaceae bacterium]
MQYTGGCLLALSTSYWLLAWPPPLRTTRIESGEHKGTVSRDRVDAIPRDLL